MITAFKKKGSVGGWTLPLVIYQSAHPDYKYECVTDNYDAEMVGGVVVGSEIIGFGDTINDAIVNFMEANEIEAEK